ncbi:MAG: hypothetical protein E7213_10140 [Clostridium sp.]|nr:hypothetical protein [Clostridium sp.]
MLKLSINEQKQILGGTWIVKGYFKSDKQRKKCQFAVKFETKEEASQFAASCNLRQYTVIYYELKEN